jgi:hypothetical protein
LHHCSIAARSPPGLLRASNRRRMASMRRVDFQVEN